MNTQITRFEPGKTYYALAIGDHNCIVRFAVKSRTAKTITASVHGETKRFRPVVRDGVEQIRPWGNYSMAPILDASRTKEPMTDWEANTIYARLGLDPQ